jgi:hypothetical protein
VVLGALTLLGLALRTRGIGDQGLWYDEIALREYSLTWEVPTFSEPPLMAWLLYPFLWWVGSADPVFIHLLPAVLGSLTIPLAYVLASRVGQGQPAGLLAAALLAISPMAIHYSREGRPYALFILLSGGVYATFIRANEDDTRRAWLASGVLLFLCSLSHLLSVEVMMVLGLASLAGLLVPTLSFDATSGRARRFMRFLSFSLVAGVAGSLWALGRAGFARAFEGLYPSGPLSFMRIALIDLGPGPVLPHVGALPWAVPELLSVAFLALFVAGLFGLWRRGRRDLAGLFFLAVVLPLLVKYLTLGERKAGWDWARWITHALLPYLVVAGLGADWLRRRLRQPALQALGLGLLAIGVLPASVDPYRRYEYEEYRSIAAYLEQNAARLKGVVILPVDWRRPGAADHRITDIYYLLKRDGLPTYHFTEGRIEKVQLRPSRGGITLLPRASGQAEHELSAGGYAVLSRRALDRCEELALWFRDPKATSRGSTPISRGLTVCDLDFGP